MGSMDTVYSIFADPVVFGNYFFPHVFYYKTPEFHHQIYDALKQMRPRQLIIAPRGTAKSTIVSFNWVLYNIAFGLASLIVIVSESFTKACIHLDRIKNAVETSREFQEKMMVVPGEPWSRGDIVLKTPFGKARVIAKGAGQSIRGIVQDRRIEFLILDDVESEATVKTKASRDALKSWFFGQAIPAIEPTTGRIVVVGTNLHYDSLIATLLKDKKTWHPLVFKIIDENGKSIWEERFPAKFISKLKEEYSRSGKLNEFYAEFMNEPVPESESLVDVSFVRYYDRWTLRKNLIYYMGVDPAGSLEDSADNTAIAVVAHDEDGNIYLIDLVADKFLPSQIVEHILHFKNLYPVRKIGIEAVGTQRGLFYAIDEELKSRGEYLPLVPIKTHRLGKKDRILSYLEPKISAGMFFIDPSSYEQTAFLNELKNLVMGIPDKDDRLDAVALALSLMETRMQASASSLYESEYEPLKIYLP